MARKKRRSKAGRPRGSRTGLSAASLADLQAEIERRTNELRDLQAQRRDVAAELDRLDREIARHGGVPGVRRRGRPPGSGRRGPGRPPAAAGARKKTSRRGRGGARPKNKLSLVDALSQVLTGKTMGVSEVADAVQKAGYKTTSENFRTIVNQALINNPKAFRKVARGQYTAK